MIFMSKDNLNRKEELENELDKIQRHHHSHGSLLKAKIKKLKEEITKAGKRLHYEGFYVKKTGDATVALVGFPSAGKSSLINAISSTSSKTAQYAFTTTSVIPGTMIFRDSHIQIFDMPGLIEEAHIGAGRGRMIISGMKVADLLVFVVDINMLYQFEKLISEFNALNINLNKPRPHYAIIDQPAGGIRIEVNRSGLPEDELKEILTDFGFNNALVSIWDRVSEDEFIALLSGKAFYIRALVALNKVDTIKDYEKINDAFAKKHGITTIPVSATERINLEVLKEKIYENLGMITIYLKPRASNEKPEPMTLKKGGTVRDAAKKFHANIVDELKCAFINGPSVKFPNQHVGAEHILMSGDTITFIKNK
jgi:hypothetical protein